MPAVKTILFLYRENAAKILLTAHYSLNCSPKKRTAYCYLFSDCYLFLAKYNNIKTKPFISS